MTKKELEYLLKVLNRITNPDEHISKAKAYVTKDIEQYNARKGQLKEMYFYNEGW